MGVHVFSILNPPTTSLPNRPLLMLPVTVQDVRGQRTAWSPASHPQMQPTRHAHRKTEPASYGVESMLVCPTLCNPMDFKLSKLLCPWDSPGKNTGVGCHSLLQGIFRTQGSNPGVLHCRQILYQLSHQGSPPPNSQAEASPSALRVFGTEHLLCRSP